MGKGDDWTKWLESERPVPLEKKKKPSGPPPPPPVHRVGESPAPPPEPARPSAEIAALEAEVAKLRAEAAAEKARAEAALSKAGTAAEELRVVAADRDRLDKETRALNRRLSEAPAPAAAEAGAASTPSLRELLDLRGAEGDGEAAAILAGLVETRALELARELRPSEPDPVRAILEDRVAFLCEADRAGAAERSVIVTVPPHRCEVCGGSDTRRAYAEFAEACALRNVRRVAIVGGSPSYRKTLEALESEHPGGPTLKLVSGRKDLGRKKAEDVERGNDLVVVWGGTILDHSVSGQFTGKHARVLTVAHRGISIMLSRVAEALRS